MSGFDDIIKVILPDTQGTSAHVTSNGDGSKNDYDHPRDNHSSGIHDGVDINYQGGQNASANRSRPPVGSPVSGTVVYGAAQGGSSGTVRILDDKGYYHDLMHLERRSVSAGDTVVAGQTVGHMSNTGTSAVHVHYQVWEPGSDPLNKKGRRVDPEKLWNDPSAVSTEDVPPGPPQDPDHEHAGETQDGSGNVEQAGGVAPPIGEVQRLLPTQAMQADDSEADRALWTNRVPQHEPWPRVLKAQPQKDKSGTQQYDDNSGMAYQDAAEPERQQLNRHHTNEFSDKSAWVSRAEGNEFIERNPLWRR